jgi:hypothetical protein
MYMSQRVNVGLAPEADIQAVRLALATEADVESVAGPTPELPDVLIVTLADVRDADEFVAFAQALQGVRYAEPDVWRFTL